MPTNPSERTELAQLALATALAHNDVLEGVGGAGGTLVTIAGRERLSGVDVSAAPGGGYFVTLRLVTRVVPLLALAAELRHRVIAAAAQSPQMGRPRAVEIQVADVRTSQ